MIMIRLRQRTLRYHLQLRQRLDLFHHLATLDDYRRLLEKFLGFYGPLEAALEKQLNRRAGGFDFDHRRKVPMLVSDLRALGVKQLLAVPHLGLIDPWLARRGKVTARFEPVSPLAGAPFPAGRGENDNVASRRRALMLGCVVGGRRPGGSRGRRDVGGQDRATRHPG